MGGTHLVDGVPQERLGFGGPSCVALSRRPIGEEHRVVDAGRRPVRALPGLGQRGFAHPLPFVGVHRHITREREPPGRPQVLAAAFAEVADGDIGRLAVSLQAPFVRHIRGNSEDDAQHTASQQRIEQQFGTRRSLPAKHFDGAIELIRRLVRYDQVIVRRAHARGQQSQVVGRHLRRAVVDGALEHAASGHHLAAVFIGVADGDAQLQQLVGAAVELLVDAFFDGGEHRHVGRLGLGAGVGVRGADQRQHEGVQRGGTSRLIACFGGLPQSNTEANAECEQHCRCGDHRQLVAGGELAQPIGATVGLCLDRQPGEVIVEIIGQCGRALVALARLALERFENDGIEITPERLGTWLVLRGFTGLSQIPTQQLRFQRSRLSGAIQARLGEQLEQHHTQRIDIGRYRDG